MRRSYKDVLLTAPPVKRRRNRPNRRKIMAGRGEQRYKRPEERPVQARVGVARPSAGTSRVAVGGGQEVRTSSFYSDQQWKKKQPAAGVPSSTLKAPLPILGTDKVSSSETSGAISVGRQVVCYKCDQEGHNSKDCPSEVLCLICEKNTHVTARRVWPTQVKPVMQPVGLGDPELGFFMAHHAKPKKQETDSTLRLILVTKGSLSPSLIQCGLEEQFPWKWRWNVVRDEKKSNALPLQGNPINVGGF